jgi:hypothetical protein
VTDRWAADKIMARGCCPYVVTPHGLVGWLVIPRPGFGRVGLLTWCCGSGGGGGSTLPND